MYLGARLFPDRSFDKMRAGVITGPRLDAEGILEGTGVAVGRRSGNPFGGVLEVGTLWAAEDGGGNDDEGVDTGDESVRPPHGFRTSLAGEGVAAGAVPAGWNPTTRVRGLVEACDFPPSASAIIAFKSTLVKLAI